MPGYGPQGHTVRTNTANDKTLESTPQEVVDALLDIIQPKSTDTLYDLGCGDGRILISAAKKYKCKAVGIEINSQTAELAKQKAKEAGVDVTIIEGDIKDQDLSNANIITMYLFPEAMVLNSLKAKTKVISIDHAIPGVNAKKHEVTINEKKYTFYIWVVPYHKVIKQ